MAIESRTPNKPNTNPGIYVGIVVNHLDPKFGGSLEIELIKTTESGNMSARTGQTVTATYMSPFYGVTPYKDITKNDGYDYTQKSYGWWAIPPDVGSKVLVLFAENNFGQAYWIGCVQDEYMNFMLPGNASTTFNDLDKAKALPVGEYNKKVETGAGRDPTKFVKPHNKRTFNALEKQGLTTDHIRGTTTSSARREAPSMVFGISTPGPVDRKGPKGKYGPQGSQSDVPINRLGGSSFVMDDGDMSLLRKKAPSGDNPGPLEYASVENGETDGNPLYPANELVRIRTRTGHQILLHNSEDLIYISHGSGNSWIEMTGDGKIDIYSKDSISVRTETDINFSADRDINFRAKNNINFTAEKNVFIRAKENVEIKADKDGRIYAKGSTHIKADLDHRETTGGKIFMNSTVEAIAALNAFVPARVPEHEPWREHENLDPESFLPKETLAKDPDLENPNDAAPLAFKVPPVPDTFKKPTK
jgi:hypothetical protein